MSNNSGTSYTWSDWTRVIDSKELNTLLDTYRSATYNNVTTGVKYCKVATISTYAAEGNHDASMQVKLRLYDATYSKPVTAIVTMSIRGRGNEIRYNYVQCNSTLDNNAAEDGITTFSKNQLFATYQQEDSVFTINLYYKFTVQYTRIVVEVLSTTVGDVGNRLNRGGGSIPMTISNALEGTQITINFASSLPVAPTTDGTYALQCSVSNGIPSYNWYNWQNLADLIQYETGYSKVDGGLFRVGNLVVGDLVIQRLDTTKTGAENIMTLPYAPLYFINSSCTLCSSRYQGASEFCYIFFNTNKIVSINAGGSNKAYIKIHICYATNDSTSNRSLETKGGDEEPKEDER
jgi:hypothetical protein